MSIDKEQKGQNMYNKIIKLSQEKGISINQLALLSRITPSDLYSALSGKKPFFPNWRKRVAEALDSTVEELFAEDERADVLID